MQKMRASDARSAMLANDPAIQAESSEPGPSSTSTRAVKRYTPIPSPWEPTTLHNVRFADRAVAIRFVRV